MQSALLGFFRGFVLASLWVAMPALAQGNNACDRETPHVLVEFVGAWDEDVKAEALSDLSAALGPQNMSACRSSDSEATGAATPVAVVTVALMPKSTVRIEVDDTLTKKRVARDIQLKSTDDVFSALMVAVAVDELLRATWAELSMKSTSESEPGSPDNETAAPHQEADDERNIAPVAFELPQHRIAMGASIDSYVQGSTFFGGDIAYGGALLDILEWTAFAGPRIVQSKKASDFGVVRADAVTFGAEIHWPFLRTSAFFFGPELSLAASHAWFRGKPDASGAEIAEGNEFSGWALSARGGLAARLHIQSAYVSAQTRLGTPLIALEVTDDDDVIGGMIGLEWSSALALGWWWP